MRNILFFFLLFLISFRVSAAQSDTSAYQTQRLKINALLAERSARFGQYDESLNARTGIFGFQTKKDIRNSNEILRQLVLNDNNIFKELKILMDYKDLEVQQVKTNAGESDERIQNYKLSIKQLQDQNQLLKAEAGSAIKDKHFAYTLSLLLLLVIGGMAWYILKKIKRI